MIGRGLQGARTICLGEQDRCYRGDMASSRDLGQAHRVHPAPPATSAHARTVMGDCLSVRGKPRARELVLGVGWQRKERELTAPTAAGSVFNKLHSRTPTEYRL